ncbi:hypothetical protein PSU4_56720 [Pseudonocardia sulfidoxydans NBRC 16205]|uniref:Mycothiol-dependent maleylpyruvate isomerase metal-binding domain-containing protein n=1 Tax=Pseudonocardia sulfidoxydans NBRC 16205 TaxID=1223511 RepID=A0A511DUF1_9PSEU|nr:maleylpyruvate isomerase family mycothiol-dependent enzyme [Pseudonocardia sulfidoxydans]GEL26718.1 hypothetical protein PSU4_56720 [Pseudonocardia sulfidoxydans NBRC 16205]
MEQDQAWVVIAQQRRALADVLDDLTPQEWEAPSLCARWRVRDVAAHLALTPHSPGLGRILYEGLRARGDFDGLNHDMAIRWAARPSTELVAGLRADADNRSRPAITTWRNLLFDTIVHVQDVAIPLGHDVAMPLDGTLAGLDRVWRMGWPFWARRRLRGLRLVATNAEWVAGEGAQVRGSAGALLLLVTGRTETVVPRLTGPGVARLADRAARPS